jgi:type II secretory pathway pseudopilin PulG
MESCNERGVSLVEVLVAAMIVIAVSAGVAHLLVWSRRAAWSAGSETTAVMLAVQKMEQLRSLPWHVDGSGNAVSDLTTNLATDPLSSTGSGLQPSPRGSLDVNTPGFMDYLGSDGRWRGTGARAPAGAAFVRRWSIVPLAADPADTLVLSVVVVPLADASERGGRPARGARLQTITTRVAW